MPDTDEISRGAVDCNNNEIPDSCELVPPADRFAPTGLRSLPAPGLAAAGGDWNEDGKPDAAVLVAAPGVPFVLALLGDGRRGFTASESSALEPSASQLLGGDFDGDGDSDLVALNDRVGTIHVLRNNRGAFAASAAIPALTDFGGASAVVALDVNEDEKLDLLLAPADGQRASVLLQEAPASFAAPAYTDLGNPGWHIRGLAAGDVDEDGLVDAVGAGTGGLFLFRHAAGGGLQSPEYLEFSRLPPDFIADAEPGMIELSDLDGDGHLDAVTAPFGESTVSVSYGTGSATFPERARLEAGRGITSVLISDVSADGIDDLILTEGRDQGQGSDLREVGVLLNSSGAPRSAPFSPEIRYQVGLIPVAALAGDWDSDSDRDLLSVNAAGRSLAFLWNRAGGEFQASRVDPVAAELGAHAFLDKDGNGCFDLAAHFPEESRLAFLAREGGHWVRRQTIALSGEFRALLPGRWNLDSSVDIVATSGNGCLLFLGGPGFDLAAPTTVAAGTLQGAVDLDGNAILDLASINPQGRLQAWTNGGSGTFTPGAPVEVGRVVTEITGIKLGGTSSEAVALGCEGGVVIFKHEGGGVLSKLQDLPVSWRVPHVLAIDLDNDSREDLVAGASGGVAIFWNQDGRLQTPQILAVGGIFPAFTAADLDQDGRPDLLCAEPPEPYLSVFRNLGDRRFEWSLGPSLGGEADEILALDLSGDDTLDVVVPRRKPGTLLSIEGLGGPVATDCDRDGLLDDCTLPGSDCDANGIADACETLPTDVRFSPAELVETTGQVTGLAVGNLDEANEKEILVANVVQGAIRVFSAMAGGGYREIQTLSSFEQPAAIVLTDLDGDMHLDLVAMETPLAANESSRLVPFRGNGRGTLARGLPLQLGRIPRETIAADFDGDAHMDIATVACSAGDSFCTSSSIYVFWGSAGGAISEAQELRLGLRARGLISAELTGDELPDLVARGELNRIVLLPGTGTRSYGEPKLIGVGGDPTSLVAGDLDGDGDSDLAVALPGEESVRILWNDPAHDLARTLKIDQLFVPVATTLADLDLDGDLDIAAPGAELCCPTGRALVFAALQAAHESFVPQYLGSSVGTPLFAGAADLDEDGRIDLQVAARQATPISLLRNVARLQAADCDVNGKLDRCDIAADPGLDVDGDGELDSCAERPFHRADTNGDGVTDISDPVRLLGFLFLGVAAPPCLEAADANNDGKLDISDAGFGLAFLFLGGATPPAPGPAELSSCGLDADTGQGLVRLACRAYDACR